MTELHLSELALDRARLGMPAEDARAHLAQCPRCRERAASRAAEDARFIAGHPAPRPVAQRWWRVREVRVVGALAAAAMVALAVVPALEERSPREVTRAKGGSQVELWIERAGVPQRFAGAPVRADDTLVFRYTSPRRYLLVVSVEDGGARSVMVADARGASTPIAPGAGVAPVGAQLDDSAHGERVYALLSDTPLVGEAALEALARGAPLGEGVDVVTWELER